MANNIQVKMLSNGLSHKRVQRSVAIILILIFFTCSFLIFKGKKEASFTSTESTTTLPLKNPIHTTKDTPLPVQKQGSSPIEPSITVTPEFKYLNTERGLADTEKMNYVKSMVLHGYNGYKKYAWGHDELNPISKTSHDWNSPYSLLMTPLDVIDTLYIIGAKQEFEDTKDLILSKLDFDIPVSINLFETNIRILGGLLSAYELSGDAGLLKKAQDLADRMLPAFDTPSGIPGNSVHLKSRTSSSHSSANLAEAGTLALEFQYLSDVTGNPVYAEKVLHSLDQIHAIPRGPMNLYANDMSTDRLSFTTDVYGLGGGADSFYEYLLKLSLATHDEKYKDMYYEAAEALSQHIVTISADGKNVYCPDRRGGSKGSSFHHLSCFAGGMFSMGALANRLGNWTKHLDLGKGIAETCYHSYANSPTGLGSESVNGETLAAQDGNSYPLRPETVESIFYMWRFTHDPKYREWGWNVVQSLEKNTKNENGYFGLRGHGSKNDRMDSFFLAETLKYLYLLFADDDTMPLEEYVFNTEAHPISIRGYGKRKHITSTNAAKVQQGLQKPLSKKGI